MVDPKFKEKVDKRLEKVKDAFIKEFNPSKIILFGSFARGIYKKNSSIDILVVINEDGDFMERIKKAISISSGNPPVEPLVYTKDELDLLMNQRDSFIDNILSEGILLYSKE